MSAWPLRLPIAGTCDGGGNFSTQLGSPVHPSYYTVARLVALTVGTGAIWTISDSAGLPLEIGQGNLVSLNPMLINPNETITLGITTATSFAPVKGQLIGVTATTLDEVLQYYLPGPNPLNISVQGAVSIVGGQGNFSDILVSGLTGALNGSHWVGATNGAAPTIANPVAGNWAVDVQGGFWTYDGTGWRWVPSLNNAGDLVLPNAGRGSGKITITGAMQYGSLTQNFKARAYLSTATAMPGNATTVVPFDTKEEDPNTNFTTGASANYSAPVAGLYLVTARTETASNNNPQQFFLSIFVAGSEVKRGITHTNRADLNAGDITSTEVTALVRVTAGQAIDIRLFMLGNAQNISGGSALTYVGIHYLSS